MKQTFCTSQPPPLSPHNDEVQYYLHKTILLVAAAYLKHFSGWELSKKQKNYIDIKFKMSFYHSIFVLI